MASYEETIVLDRDSRGQHVEYSSTQYSEFIEVWRRGLMKQQIGDVYVLQVPPENEKEDSNFAHLEFTYKGLSCAVKFKMHDIYLIAARNHENEWFALRHSNIAIPNSTLLPVSVGYDSLLKDSHFNSFNGANIGLAQLQEAVSTLAKLETSTEYLKRRKLSIARACTILAFLYAEGSRLNSIKDDAVDYWVGNLNEKWTSYSQVNPDTRWRSSLINNWGNMSEMLVSNHFGEMGTSVLNEHLQKLDIYNRQGQIRTLGEMSQELGVAKRSTMEREMNKKKKGKTMKEVQAPKSRGEDDCLQGSSSKIERRR